MSQLRLNLNLAWRHVTQNNSPQYNDTKMDIQHYDAQENDISVKTLNMTTLCIMTEHKSKYCSDLRRNLGLCRYTECRYTEC